MTLTYSRRLALVGGLAIPLVEAWRRWAEWDQVRQWPFILDDFIAGGLLVVGALMARRAPRTARPVLAAAWGVACGMMYYSFFGQLVALGKADPSGAPSSVVVVFKGALLAGCISGLIGALRSPQCPPDSSSS